MNRVIFQHLTSEVGEGRLRDTIYLFGRQENGQSICVHVPDYKPHITIKTNEKQEDFEKNIQQQFLYLLKCERAEYQKKYKNETELFMYMDNPKWHLEFEWDEGQDLCNFNEDGPSQFVTIRSHPMKFFKLKSMLKYEQKIIVDYDFDKDRYNGLKKNTELCS